MRYWLLELWEWAKLIVAGVGLLIPALLMLAVFLMPTALIVTIIVLLWRHFG